jgi:hypothetical protein
VTLRNDGPVIIIPGEKRGATLEGYGADSREQVSKRKGVREEEVGEDGILLFLVSALPSVSKTT